VTFKIRSAKDVRSQGGYPLRTRGDSSDGHVNFLQKAKIIVCPHGQERREEGDLKKYG